MRMHLRGRGWPWHQNGVSIHTATGGNSGRAKGKCNPITPIMILVIIQKHWGVAATKAWSNSSSINPWEAQHTPMAPETQSPVVGTQKGKAKIHPVK